MHFTEPLVGHSKKIIQKRKASLMPTKTSLCPTFYRSRLTFKKGKQGRRLRRRGEQRRRKTYENNNADDDITGARRLSQSLSLPTGVGGGGEKRGDGGNHLSLGKRLPLRFRRFTKIQKGGKKKKENPALLYLFLDKAKVNDVTFLTRLKGAYFMTLSSPAGPAIHQQ